MQNLMKCKHNVMFLVLEYGSFGLKIVISYIASPYILEVQVDQLIIGSRIDFLHVTLLPPLHVGVGLMNEPNQACKGKLTIWSINHPQEVQAAINWIRSYDSFFKTQSIGKGKNVPMLGIPFSNSKLG